MEHLKIISMAENAKFINANKIYKIPGSAIIAVNEYLKHLFSAPKEPDWGYTMKTVNLLSELSQSFKAESFEAIEQKAGEQ